MKKQAILLILCFTMLIGMLPTDLFASNPSPDNFNKINTYVYGQFDDVKSSDWFSPNVANAYELGLMIGTSDTVFNSYGNVTIAEAVTMAARIHMIYTVGSEKFEQTSPWYQSYVDYVIKNGVISQGYSDYNKVATRAEFATILAGALPDEALTVINTVVDGSIPDVDVNASYSLKVYKLYRAGILAGNDSYGIFTPDSNIARAAAAAIVTRMANPSLRVKINLEETVQILYAVDGRTRITLKTEIEAYLKVGWYKEPVVIMYAPDGRTRYTLKSEVEAYKGVGWYINPIINMYSTDGRTLIVKKADIESYKAVGWYECRLITGHVWVDATCTTPKACSACGLTEGAPLGHNYGTDGICTRCGDKIQVTDTDFANNENIVLTAEQIYSQCSSAVFYISVYDVNKKLLSTGSGFFIDSNGTAVTNYHVIEDASYAKIKTSPDGLEYDVVGVYDYSKKNDLALIKINGTNFKYLQIDDSNVLNGGANIFTIGSPLGLENSISQGIISNTKRLIDDVPYIQISAPISPGSSGGALLSDKGKVIGVTSAYFTEGQNLNLAIPISLINNFKRNSITDLPTLLKNAQLSRKVSASVSNVTVNTGTSQTITIYAINMDVDDTLDNGGNNSYINLKWNDWIDDETISLTITGKSAGVTILSIELKDKYENVLSVIYINVTVVNNKQVYGYFEFPAVPDFGAYYGVNPFYQKYEYGESMGKYYAYYAYEYADMPYSEAAADYLDLLSQYGFLYYDYYYNDDGQKVLIYRNLSVNNEILIQKFLAGGKDCLSIFIS